MYDIIIIGSGTAGMTAAIYGARSNHKTLLIEATVPGGQIINTMDIENYPGLKNINGYDYSMNMKEQATSLGAQYVREEVVGVELLGEIKEVITTKNIYKSKTVIIATGGNSKKLEVKGEDEFTGKGVSFCATCDGNFFRNKDVVVVGGGNTALEDALFLSNICNKVYLVHRRQGFRGDQYNIDALKKKPNVELVLDYVVEEIKGSGVVETISVKNVIDNSTRDINASAIFVAIGQTPQTEIFKEAFDIDENGYAIISEDTKSNIAGVYVAGDIRVKPLRQLVTAAADGATAASAASAFLNLQN